MKSKEEILEIINYFEKPFEERLEEDIKNPKFSRIECTDYMDRIIINILKWIIE